MLYYRIIIKTNVIDSTIEEICVGVNLCNVPSKDELEASSFSNLLQWDAINPLTNNPIQPEEISEEQNLAITICINSIDS